MKYSIVYSSTGNTKTLANVVKDTLNKDDCIYFGPNEDWALKAERIYIGFWTNKGTCDDITANFIKQLKNQEIFLFGSAGFGLSQDYFDKILAKVKEIVPEGVKIVGTYMCQGKMPMSVKERYLKMKEDKAPVPNIDMLIKNFDMALSHPDENDFENLRKAIK